MPGSRGVRVRVVAPDGGCGSSWSIKTSATEGDVYVTHREGGVWTHISLHRDGQWHHAITLAGQDLVPGTPRHLGVSRVHREFAPGWIHAVRITVAVDELRDNWQEGRPSRRVVDVPVQAGFDALHVDVLLGAPDATAVTVRGAASVAELARGDGGRVLVQAQPANLDAPVRVALRCQIEEAVDGTRALGWDGMTPTRLVIFGNDPAGFIREVEVAVDPDA